MNAKLIGGLLHATAAAAFTSLLTLGAAGAATGDAQSPHSQALAALSDIETAVFDLDSASRLTEHVPEPYKAAAQRALDALVGAKGAEHGQPAGSSSDEEGAIGHLQWLADHAGSAPWKSAVQGAEVNASAAEARLHEAIDADDLEHFQLSASSALEALLVALGHDSDVGPLAGLRGALATTSLGVPDDAMMVGGCATPKVAPGESPAYGVENGYLTFVAIGDRQQNTRLPESIGTRDISVKNGTVVLYTAATNRIGTICPHEARSLGLGGGDPQSSVVNNQPASSSVVPITPAAPQPDSGQHKAADPPRLYTEAQAEQGKQVYDQKCAVCHGDQLQGKSAPAIAGTDFLKKADLLGWSVADLRTIVVTTMPRDNPGSLSPDQYAAVLAYLLGKDCYPAGQDKFPTTATEQIDNAKLQPVNAADKNQSTGTCTVQQASK
jgi:polar amino acid transport system substrate-binding protein